MRGRRERGSEEDEGEEGGREVVMRMERKEGKRYGEGGWRGKRGEVVRRRMERNGVRKDGEE